MKKILLLVLCLVITGCTSKNNTEEKEVYKDVYLDLTNQMIKEDTGTSMEMCQFVGEDVDDQITSINEQLQEFYDYYYEIYKDEDLYAIELYNYPYTNERYVNLVYTFLEIPNYATDGNISSLCYDKKEGKFIDDDEAFKLADITYEQLEEAMSEYVGKKENYTGIEIREIAYYIDENSDVTFIVNYCSSIEGAIDECTSFYIYHNGEIQDTENRLDLMDLDLLDHTKTYDLALRSEAKG